MHSKEEAKLEATFRHLVTLSKLSNEPGTGTIQLSFDFPKHQPSFIEGIIDGFPFRAPIIQTQDGPAIQLTQAILKAINAQPGDEVCMEITRIGDEPEVRMPEDWSRAVHSSPNAAALWHEITPMARREWIRWVASAKQEKTRQSRIEAGIDMLEKGKRRPCCFPGINWVTKDLVSPEETWTALPKS